MISAEAIQHELDRLLEQLRRRAPNAIVMGVGMDVETSRLPNRKTARFFLTDNEQEWLKGQSDVGLGKTLLRLWTVKEAIFKADPENDGRVVGEYVLDDPAEWIGAAYRQDQKLLRFHYSSMQAGDGFLSIAVLAKGEGNA